MGRRPFLFENPEKYSRVSKSEYEAGDKSALMRIIVDCALSKSPIPEWAASILERRRKLCVLRRNRIMG